MSHEEELRGQLAEMLRGGHAHATFDQAVDGFPAERAGDRAEGLPHSAWELLEHLRISQDDIVRFSRSSDYEELKWPAEYWPASAAPPDDRAWQSSVETFRRNLQSMIDLIRDPARDLFAPFSWGQGQTLLREAILLVDHNAYHLGQLVLLRRALGTWK